MKILYVLSGTELYAGSTKSFLTLLDFIKEFNDQVLVITPDKKGVYGYLKSIGIPVIALKYRIDVYPRNKTIRSAAGYIVYRFINYITARKLRKICMNFKPDLIHSNSSVINIGYLVSRWMNIPHIWHVREYGDKDFNLHICNISKKLLAPMNYTISITKDIAKYRKIEESQYNKVIYNGIMHKKDCNPSPKKKEDYFLYAGRIEQTKGIEDLIHAYSLMKKEIGGNVKLLVAGSVSYGNVLMKKRIDNFILNNNLNESVTWLGECGNIDEIMSLARATIVPSYSEGFGRVMPEAMFNGCLVIGRNTGGTKEQMDNGVDLIGREIALRFETIEQLKDQMIKVASFSPETFRSYVEGAFETVNKMYTIESNGLQIRNFYNEILSSTL